MTPGQIRLLHDARLSREARLIGLHVSGLGDGFHEVSHGAFRRMLGRGAQGMPKRQTLAGYIQELQEYGWVDRKPGGSGSPRYRFTVPQGDGIASTVLQGDGSVESSEGTVEPVGSPEGTSSGPLEGPQSLARATTSSLPPPPPPPPPSEVCDQAREFVTDATSLVGCRDALCDYLTERVEVGRQLAYAQTVAGIIEGTDEAVWMKPGGEHVRESRQPIIAGCLNELRQGDEIGRYFPGPPGDVANLRSKIRYKVRSLAGAERDKARKQKEAKGTDWLYDEPEPETEEVA